MDRTIAMIICTNHGVTTENMSQELPKLPREQTLCKKCNLFNSLKTIDSQILFFRVILVEENDDCMCENTSLIIRFTKSESTLMSRMIQVCYHYNLIWTKIINFYLLINYSIKIFNILGKVLKM